ncbi:MAG: hypothetical protein HQK51_08645 [Oligoflexia bacterium]|nr:hypothetical protein [Oligoflexia bacterium]
MNLLLQKFSRFFSRGSLVRFTLPLSTTWITTITIVFTTAITTLCCSLPFLQSIPLAQAVTSASFHGDWSSGGGDISEMEKNPWFIENTENVPFCVQIDEKNFGASKDVAVEKIFKAIDHWNREFNGYKLRRWNHEVRLATQKFHEVPCNQKHLITFQFGVLQNEQKEYFKQRRINRIVGHTVRTSYDEENLRGEGFVYIAPEEGELAPNWDGIYKKHWQLAGGRLLEFLLVHEIGHIFGVPHLEVGFDTYPMYGMLTGTDYMDDDFPMRLISAEYATQYVKFDKLSRIFNLYRNGIFTRRYEACEPYFSDPRYPSKIPGPKIFGIPSGWGCVAIEGPGFPDNGEEPDLPIEVKLYAAIDRESAKNPANWKYIGSFSFSSVGFYETGVVMIYVNDKQKVFPGEVPHNRLFHSTAGVRIRFLTGFTYTSPFLKEKRVGIIEERPGEIHISAPSADGEYFATNALNFYNYDHLNFRSSSH